MKLSETAYKRCRPQLGTFVEISLSGVEPEEARKLGERGFAEIDKIASVMSFHDPKSELSELTRARVGRWKKISPELLRVLELSRQLNQKTGGAYSVAVGDPLVRWNFLPGKRRSIDWRHLSMTAFEIRASTARRNLPVRIDLGGIAKGFAVDCAVESIRSANSKISGVVNAGGDLRVFGPAAHPVHIRVGRSSRSVLFLAALRNEALATSTVNAENGKSPYVNIRRQKCLVSLKTAVARAPDCMVADALTKVALLVPKPLAEKIAREFGAELGLVS